MSEIEITVAAGPSHLNSGDLRDVDVLGVLHVGGSGLWRFTKFTRDTDPRTATEVLMLDSQRNLIAEIRAGVALALGLGTSHQIIEAIVGKDWTQTRLKLTNKQLHDLGEQARNQGVALLITSMDESVTEELATHIDDAGWSIHLATVTRSHRETQWDTK